MKWLKIIIPRMIKCLVCITYITCSIALYYIGKHQSSKIYIEVPIIQTDTLQVTYYRDTCDSQFDKAILEAECSFNTLQALGKTPTKVVGDGGRAIGVYQMHKPYFKSSHLANVLGYTYIDMHSQDKANHVFWAQCGVFAYMFHKQHGRLPTKIELAMIHNGGYYGYKNAQVYKKKFIKFFNKNL